MAQFTITHDVQQPVDQTFEKVKSILGQSDVLKKYDPKVECLFDSASKTCKIKGSQFKADLKVDPIQSGGTKVAITIDLPFLLMPFKGKISESLLKLFQKHLG